MSYKQVPSKQTAAVQELRRSNAAGIHENRRPRGQIKRKAIREAMA